MESYKRQHVRYFAEKGHWCMTFEERGYFLAVGNQFAVLLNERSGQSQIVWKAGERNISTKENLEARIIQLTP